MLGLVIWRGWSQAAAEGAAVTITRHRAPSSAELVPRSRRSRVVALGTDCLVLAVAVTLATVAVPGRARPAPAAKAPAPPAPAAAVAVSSGLVDVVATLGYEGGFSEATGMVLTHSGEVLTNNHVISGATAVAVTDLGDRRTYRATVVGYDSSDDIAVLQLTKASGLTTVRPALGATVTAGEEVVSLGNAGGRGGRPSVMSGTVTGVDAAVISTDEAEHATEQLSGMIRTSTALQAGDSGGPLVTSGGMVIGMNTAATPGNQPSAAGPAGYAIPIARAMSVARQISAGRSSATVHVGGTGFLGVEMAVDSSSLSGALGAAITGVIPGSPVAATGLAAGDVLVTIAGAPVLSSAEVQPLLDPYRPGDRVDIGWQDPSGQQHTASVVLAAGPAG